MERETVLDGESAPPGRYAPRGRNEPEGQRRNNQHYRGDDTTPRRRNRDDYDSRSLRKGRRLSSEYERDGRGRRGERGRSRRSSYYSDAFSDEDDGARRRRRRSEKSYKSSRFSDSETESDDHSGRRRRKKGRGHKEGRRRGPTNVDDFNERDWSESGSSSESSYSSDYTGSDSDSERGQRRRLRSSASVSAIPHAAWALLGQSKEGTDSDARIKSQQGEIKKLLTHLGELQKKSGVKALPAEKQKVLQQDLHKLELLQTRRKEKPGNASILTQLIGQQMLLSDHLRDAIDIVKVKVRAHNSTPTYLCMYIPIISGIASFPLIWEPASPSSTAAAAATAGIGSTAGPGSTATDVIGG